ncbi:MAG TPA: twin-arginine translocase subunit TatC [Deltaproteobacteria bacterium]|nr:twin-arginine translocase subunit TatC [Deltaproteobacteria bacterium]HQH99721.1 twin-arginine translocase subunit TatC [Deltaproteobacteria bacterium]
MDEEINPTDDKLPITDHLEELRWRIIKSLIAVGVGFVVSYAFADRIFNFLTSPLTQAMPEGSHIIYTSLPEAFFTYMKVAFFSGLIFSAPVIFYQIWKFVMPGLYENERKYVVPFVLVATFFFVVGVTFAFFVVFPVAFKFFMTYSTGNIVAFPSMREYLGFTMKFLLGFGLTFELPVVMYFLAKMGVVNAGMLRRNRKYAILVVAVVAAVLTPGPDVFSQCMLGIPLYVLYEMSIWVAQIVGKKRARAKKAEPDNPDDEPHQEAG